MSVAKKELRNKDGGTRSRSPAVLQDARMPSQSQAEKDPLHNTTGSHGQWGQGPRSSWYGSAVHLL